MSLSIISEPMPRSFRDQPMGNQATHLHVRRHPAREAAVTCRNQSTPPLLLPCVHGQSDDEDAVPSVNREFVSGLVARVLSPLRLDIQPLRVAVALAFPISALKRAI